MKLRSLLFLVLCTALFGACSHDEMQRRLAEVDSLTDAHYDSALVLLAGMDSLPMRRADRMYLELLRGKAMNKASVPFTTDSVMRRVAAYYDHHGSPNRRLLAHYVLGCAYRDLGSAPRALEEYQRAASLADTTRADCDLSTLMRVHSQMAELYLRMRMEPQTRQQDSIAGQLCWKMGDTITALYYESTHCRELFVDMQYEECIRQTQALYQKYKALGLDDDAALMYSYCVKSYLELGDYPKVRESLDIYETCSYLQSDPRKVVGGRGPWCVYRGRYYMGIGDPDSAELWFRRALPYVRSRNNALLVYRSLYELYAFKHEGDSVAKYSNLYSQEKDKTYNSSNTEASIQIASLFNYNVEQQISRQKEQENARLRVILYVAILLFLLSVIVIQYYKLVKEQEEKEVAKLRMQYLTWKDELHSAKEQLSVMRVQVEEKERQVQEGLIEYSSIQAQVEESEQIISRLTCHIRELENSIRTWEAENQEENEPGMNAIKDRINNYVTRPGTKGLTKELWRDFIQETERTYPLTTNFLKQINKISKDEYRVSLLLLAGYSPSMIELLMDMTSGYATKVRKRLLQKVFQKEGAAHDYDTNLRRLSSKNAAQQFSGRS